ncbi:hypothetical protein [Wenxinia saemankumensis]|uniref:Response regulator receiver domain-containing protein n=1 Tax=Wenxinia saemankumensis TaxID=1447782 RepID=A0A1M6EFW3_9RHOB|nr:hypothetical protein [Wenxinia saemankumensis]SHI84376.1 hypothetical protein SAMN05444417_1981 [Wenxinia saemankumensis]
MNVLLVDAPSDRAANWAAHLRGAGFNVERVETTEAGLESLRPAGTDIAIVNFDLDGIAALADFCQFRRPDLRLIAVTDDADLTRGGAFAMSPQARAVIGGGTPAADLAALVEHYGRPQDSAAR